MEAKSAFEALINKIQTLKNRGDGAFRVSFDIPLIFKKDVQALMDIDETELVSVVVIRKPKRSAPTPKEIKKNIEQVEENAGHTEDRSDNIYGTDFI